MDLTAPQTFVADSLADACYRYKRSIESVLEAYEAHPTDGAEVTPHQLHAAVEHFFNASRNIEKSANQGLDLDPNTASELGDYGITLLMDLGSWARQLGVGESDSEFDQIALTVADWVMRHGGEIRTLEPVVDSLARLSNRARDIQTLEKLTDMMTRVIHATCPTARKDHAKTRPSEPWRTLHLNRGIVVTRTHNTLLMESVFEEMIADLPSDAGQFFADGMRQMERFDFPTPVRAVMKRFFDRWTRPRMQ